MRGGAAVSFGEIEKVLPLKSWWAMVGVLPIVRPLTWLAVNHTRVTPNAITITSILCRFVTAGAFLSTTQTGYVVGALAYYLAYLLDCMDGAVARLRKMSSEFGRFLDHVGDLAGDVLILAALAYSQQQLITPMVAGMLFMHVAESYISYLAGALCRDKAPVVSSFSPFNWFNRYRDWWFDRNRKSFFSFPDYTAFIFLFCPLIYRPSEGLRIGFWILLGVCLYTILSTFVSLNTGRKHFP